MKLPNLRADLRVALLYAIFGALWILLSDELLAGLVTDIATLSRLQTYKGWAFVAASALLIFSLLRRELRLRQHAEGDFHESEERFRLLFENSLDAILLSAPDGRILAANPAACQMFGRSEQELKELGPHGLGDRWEQRLQTGSFRGELSLARQDGTRFPAEVSATLFQNKEGRPCISLVIRDITAPKQAEEHMQRQLKRLNSRHLVDIAILSSFDLHLVLDIALQQVTAQLGADASVVLLLNPELQVLEYAASRGLGLQAIEHVKRRAGTGYAGRVMLARKTIRNAGFKERGGAPTPTMILANEPYVDYFGVPLMVKGEIKGVLEIYHHAALQTDPDWLQFLETLAGQVAIAIENTQLFRSLQRANTQLEQHVAERTAELRQANLELADANRARSEFLATMSHELRTPLNSILGLAESLLEQKQGRLNEHQQKYLRTIEASGRHLSQLINDILDLSHIEAGRLDYQPQAVIVDELCRSSLALVDEQAQRKSIRVQYQNEADLDRITADPRRLKQILVSLLSNAIKFTPAGGSVTLQVRAGSEPDRLCLSVIDNGIGLAPEDLPKLLEPFVQGEGGLDRPYEGAGLGLALVQKLTDLHGGRLEVESEVGNGSRFTIDLPIGQPEAMPPREETG